MAASEKILYIDCVAGICGDLIVAALVDLGVPESHLRAELAKLGLDGWRLRLSPGSKNGIDGTRADIDLLPYPARSLFRAGGSHEHRAYRELRATIEASGLSPSVKSRVGAIYGKLAEAEAKAHGTTIEEVRFHEVGAVDSIVDIVAAAICIDYLAPDRVLCSSVELGGGFVKCRHGLLPVPVPAVVELLRGVPVRFGAVPMETTTPTGAAFLAAFVDEYSDERRFRVSRSGYGIGHRDTELPDILAVSLGELDGR